MVLKLGCAVTGMLVGLCVDPSGSQTHTKPALFDTNLIIECIHFVYDITVGAAKRS